MACGEEPLLIGQTLKNTDLARAVTSTFSQPVLDQLAGKFGLSPEILLAVIAHASPVLVISWMASASTGNGAIALFSAVMSSDTNARIAEQMPELVKTTDASKEAEMSGNVLASRATGRSIAVLSDHVSTQTGVPTQATHALTGLVSATLFGVLKHHVLLEQGTLEQLPAFLADQWPVVAGYLNDSLAAALGFGSADEFANAIPGQLRVLSTTLIQQATSGLSAAGTDTPRVAQKVINSPAQSPSRKNRWIWALFGVLTVVLGGVVAYAWVHPAKPDPDSADTATPGASVAASAAAPASGSPASTPAATAAGPVPASSSVVVGAVVASAASAPVVGPPAPVEAASAVGPLPSAGTPTLAASTASPASSPDTVPLPSSAPQANELKPVQTDAAAASNDGPGMSIHLRIVPGASQAVEAASADQAEAGATALFQKAITGYFEHGISCDPEGVARLLNGQLVNFARGSAHVPSSAMGTLGESANLLKACADIDKVVPLQIAVYSDTAGSAQANLNLSKKRAQAVRDFLIHAGVPERSLTAEGYGATNPVVNNGAQSAGFANRRVEFIAAHR